MNPDDNSLESGYEGSTNTPIPTAPQPVQVVNSLPPQPPKKDSLFSTLKFGHLASVVSLATLAIVVLVGGSALLYNKLHPSNSAPYNSESSTGSNYKVGSTLSVQQASQSQLVQLGQVNELAVNGNLTVSKSVMLTPGNAPAVPVAGEIYYDQTNNAPYYYNGSQFVSLAPAASPTHVTTLGGAAGVIGLGTGLSVNGGTLSVASSLLQSVNSALTTPVVSSLQGLTGNVTLTGGAGISISGTTISNSGVISLTSSNSSINVANNGNGSYDLTLGGNGAVLLGPTTAQTDTSNNPALYINKTGTADLIDLQDSGVDAFVVSQSGQITTGTIDYSQVQGRPSSVVTDISGNSGSISLGSGLSISDSTLSNSGVVNVGGETGGISLGSGLSIASNTLSNSGVTSVTGSPDEISASSSTGDITLSLPQAISTTSNPTFNDLNLGGALTADGLAALNGGATADSLIVSGGTTLSGASAVNNTLSVEDALTLGTPGSVAGNLYLSNTTSSNVVDLIGENPSGSGNAVIQFPTIDGNTTDTVCLKNLANCGSSNSISASSSGVTNTIPVFTGTNTLGNSSITDDGSTVTVSELLSASTISTATIQSTGSLDINPGGNLSIGASNHALSLVGDSASSFAESANSYTDTLDFTAPTTASNTITIPDATGTVCLEGSSSCDFASSGSGVTSVDTLTGALSINDTSGSETAITIQDASTSEKGIAEFNSGDFQSSDGVIDTIQGITTTSDVQFDSLALDNSGTCTAGGNLCLGNDGTVYASNYSNPSSSDDVVFSGGSNNIEFEDDSGANSFSFPTYGGTGQTICTSGITCASGGGQAVILGPSGVQDTATDETGIYVDKTGGTGDLIDLQTGSSQDALVIDSSGNATFSNTTTAATLDVTGTLQAETITPNAALTVGSTSESFTLQGDQSSEILGASSTNSTYVGFGTPSGNSATAGSIYYDFDNSAATNTSSSPYFICTTAGNCSGTGGSVTALGGSAEDDIPLFTSTASAGGNIADSILSETGSDTVNVAGDLDVGASGLGQLSVGVGSTVDGTIVLNNSINSNNITLQQAAAPSSNVTIDLPTSSGTVAVSATGPLELDSTTGVLSCPDCDSSGGGGVSAVQSVNSLTGTITLNNATTSGQDIQIDYAKADGSTLGIAAFNSTDFKDNGSGVIDTVQGITTSSSPTFDNLTLQGTTGLTLGSTSNDGEINFLDGTSDGYKDIFTQATLTDSQAITIPDNSGTLAVAASGNLSLSTLGNLTITNSPTFSTSVTTPLLESSGALSITPSGSLTEGATNQSFTLQGNSSSAITATSGSDTTTLDFDTPTAANTIYIPNQGGTVCLSGNNCDFEASGNYINNQTTQQTDANIDIESVSDAVAATIEGASGQNILNLLAGSGSTVASFSSTGTLTTAGTTLTGTALTFGSSTDSITGPSGSSITLDTTGSSTLNLGNTNATTVNLGNSSASTTVNGSGVTIQAGSSNLALTTGTSTGNITLTTDNASSSIIAKSSKNSTIAFELQDTNGDAYLTGDSTDDRIDIGTIGTPSEQLYVSGTIPTYVGENSDSKLDAPYSVYVQGNYAYVASEGNSKLVVYDISSGTPVYVGENSDSNLDIPVSVYVQGNYAYVASLDNNELVVYNISNPASPTYVGENSDSKLDDPYSVYVQGNYAYVASEGNSKLVVYDISSGTPVYVGENSDSKLDAPYPVYVQGNYAYVASLDNSELVVYNISSGTPVYVGENSDSNLDIPVSVYVQGNYAYVASAGNKELVVYNISNPASPTYVGENSDSKLDDPYSVYVQGNYAYVASAGNSKLVVYDISNPASPTYVGENSDSNLDAPRSVYVQGNYAYVASGSGNRLVVYNLGGTYSQQLSAGGINTGTLSVTTDASIAGDLGIQGGLSVGTNENINGNLGIQGSISGASLTLGTSGSTSGQLTINSSGSGGSFVLEPSSDQANTTTLTIPTDTGSTDTLCLVTLANCSGSSAGSGDTSYIWNTDSTQPSSNFDISGDGVIGGTLSVTSTINGATISGGTLSGSTLSSTGLTFSGSSGSITAGSGDDLTLDTTGSATLNLGNTNATTINLGNSSSTSSINGSTLTLQAGSGGLALTTGTSTGNITLTTDNDSSSVIVQSSTDSTSAFQVQNSSASILNVDTTGNGNITVGNSSNPTTITMVGGATSLRPSSPSTGMLYYDTTTDQLVQYNGTKWMSAPDVATEVVAPSTTGGGTQAEQDAANYVATGTDDGTTINDAIAALPSTGGIVYLEEGTYYLDTTAVSLSDNVTLAGVGDSTVLEFANGVGSGTYYAITNSDTSTGTNVDIQNLLINGNKANQSEGVFNGIYFDKMGSSTTPGGTISNVEVENIYGNSSNTSGISLDGSSNNSLSGNTVDDNDEGGIQISGSGSSSGNIITGNTVDDNSGSGISLASASGSLSISENTVTSNTVDDNQLGIEVNSSNNTFTNNTVENSSGEGMNLGGSSGYSAANNTISSNNVSNSGGTTTNNGIRLLNYSTNNSITDNVITDSSCTTNCYAIDISGSTDTTGNYLSGNVLTSTETINDATSGGNTYASQSLTSNGDADFRNGTDSSTAFQVQDAAGTGLMQVDTSGNNIYLGDNSSGTGTDGTTVNIGSVSSDTYTSTVDIGTSSGAAQTVTIGSTDSSSSLTLQSGSSALSLQTAGGDVDIGTNNTANTVQVGSTSLSSGTQTIDIGNNDTSGGTTDILIGTGSSASGTLTLQSAGTLALGNGISPTINVTTKSGGTLDLGNTNATTINLGNSSSSTTLGGTFSESYSSSSASSVNSLTVANTDSSSGVTVQGIDLTPTNTTSPSSGNNTVNLLNFAQGSTLGTDDTTNGINFASATGYSSFINAPNFNLNTTGAVTLGTSGTTSGKLTINSSGSGGSFVLEPSSDQANTTTITIPTDTGSTDTLCLVTLANCSGSSAGSGDTSYIFNQTTQQTGANIDIGSASGDVAAKIQGASGQNILDLFSSSSDTTPVAYFDSSGDLIVSSDDINGATISGGTLSGSTLSSTGLTFSGSSGTVTTASGDNLTIDTGGGTSTLNLGNTNATTVNLGNTSSTTNEYGSGVTIQAGSSNLALTTGTSTGNITLTTDNASSSIIAKSSTNSTTAFELKNSSGTNLLQVDTSGNNIYLGGTTNSTEDIGAVGSAAFTSSINIGTSTGAAQTVDIGSTNGSSSLTLQAGEGITVDSNINQSASSGSSTGTISLLGQTATNANTSAVSTTVNGDSITLIGTNNSNSGANVLNGINFNNVTSATYNTFNGLYFGSGYTNGIDFSSSTCTNYIDTPSFVLQCSNGNITGAGTYDGATISGGTLSGSTLSSTGLTFSGSSGTVTTASGDNLTIDTGGGTSTLNLGNTNATTVNLGNTSSTTNEYGSGVTIQAGSSNLALTTGTSTGNITLTTDNASSSIIAKSSTNSTTAFQIQNSSSSSNVLLNADTSNMRLEVDATTTSMGVPSGLSVGSATTGGSLTASTTYYYEVTAIDSMGGQTTASSQASGTTTSGNTTLPLTWTAVTGASGYEVYRSTTSGGEVYLTTVLTNSFTDSGSITAGTATPPSTNTAYTITSTSNNQGQLIIGGNGTPSQQLYVSGTSPTYVGKNSDSNLSAPYSVYVQGNYAYVASEGNSKLVVYDISSGTPVYVGENSDSNLDIPVSVYVQGNYAYVASLGNNELVVYNISNPASPTYVGENSDSNLDNPYSVYVQGNYAYVASEGNSKLVVYNISNPASPTYVGENSDSKLDAPHSVYVQGNYAYVASEGNSKLVVYNISNPASPTYVGENSDSNLDIPVSVYVQGNYAYVASEGNSKLVVYNISNPASPTYVGENSDSNLDAPRSVYVQGNYAYVASLDNNELVVYNISNPASPTYVGENSDSNLDNPYSVYVQGNYAYVASYSNKELVVYNLGGTYSQQLSAGGINTGTLSVTTDASIAGDLGIQGGLSVGTNAQIDNNLGVEGNTYLQGSTYAQGATILAGGILGGATISGISTPSAPTITPEGTAGTTSYSYKIVAVGGNSGTTPASTAGSTTTGNATLSSTNYNQITWTAVSGATSYEVFRTVAGGTSPTTTGLIGTTDATIFNDTGLAGDGTSAPTVNTTGQLTLNGYLTINGAASEPVAVFNNSSDDVVAEIDSSGNLDLGSSGSFTGNLVFESSVSSSGTVTLTSDVASSANSYTLDLPTTAPSATGECLGDPSSKTQLGFSSCISGDNSADIVVPAEYAGAVLDAAGDSSCSSSDTGIMTAGNSDNTTNENYYEWTTSQSSAQCYDVVVQVPLPSDFGSFNGTPSIYDAASSGSSIAVEPLTCSGSVDSNYSGYATVTSTSSLASESLPSALGSSYTSCGYITLRFRLKAAASGGTAQIGTITIPYTTSTTNN